MFLSPKIAAGNPVNVFPLDIQYSEIHFYIKILKIYLNK